MKKVIIGAITIVSILISCQKEEVKQIVETDKETEVTNLLKTSNATYCREDIYVGGVLVDIKCEDPGSGCGSLTEVVGKKSIVENVIDKISLGSNQDIIDEFEYYESDLETLIDPIYVDGIIDGTYTVDNFGDLSEIAYWTFYDSNNQIVWTEQLTE